MFPDNYPKLRGYLNRFVGRYVKQIINEFHGNSYHQR